MAVPLSGGGDADRPARRRADLEARVAARASARRPTSATRCARCGWPLRRRARLRARRGDRAADARRRARVPEAAGERVFAELRRLVLAPRRRRGPRAGRPARPARRGAARARRPARRRAEPLPPPRRVRPHARGARAADRAGATWTSCSAADAASSREVLAEPLADELTRGQALRFGALLHDIGKPATRGVRAGRPRHVHRPRRRRRGDGARALPAAAHQRAPARFLGRLTRHHLVLGFLVHERPLDRARGLPLPEAAPSRWRWR